MDAERQRVGRAFHRGALEYDQHTPLQQRVVSRLCERLAQQLQQPPQQVLDVGCGTGQLLQQLAQQYAQASLTGIDLAPNMLQMAAGRLGGRAVLVQGDAEQLPFSDGSFDLVVSSSTFQWLEQCDTCFSEVHRVLRGEGRFCFALFGAGTLHELQWSWQEALSRAGRSPVGDHDGTHRFHTQEEVCRSLEKQGFDEREVVCQREILWYPDVAHLLQSIKRIGAGTARPQGGGGLGWRRILHEMAAIYTERFGTGKGVPASYQVIYGSGRVCSGRE